jgi:hypothetical protein
MAMLTVRVNRHPLPRGWRLLVAGALVALLALGCLRPTPAEASSGKGPFAYDQCPQGAFCVWTGSNGTAFFAYFYVGSKNLTWPIGGYVFNDRITSYWNRDDHRWCLYRDINYRGYYIHFDPTDRGNLLGYWDNEISSLKYTFGGC